MINKYDYPRLSTYVGGIIDRRMRPVTLAITSSIGYLRTLVTQSGASAAASATSASNSQVSAQSASASNAAVTVIYNNFTSTYLGVRDADIHAQKSALNNNVTINAFYIRSADSHLRYVAAIDPNSGAVTWQDALVSVDVNSIYTAGDPRYLMLAETDHTQSVQSAVTFSGILGVPSVSDWTTSQPPRASDIATYVGGVKTSLVSNINAEISRAEAAETSLSNQVAQAYTDLGGYAKAVSDAVQANLNTFASTFTSGSNSNGYWEKRFGGIIEQWGRITLTGGGSVAASTINFPIEFGDAASISINTTSLRKANGQWAEVTTLGYADPTTTYCDVVIGSANSSQHLDSNMVLSWRAIGFSAPPTTPAAPANNGSASGSDGTVTAPTNTGSPASNDPGNTGTGGGSPAPYTPPTYDPNRCVEDDTTVLLANADHTGPGSYIAAGDLTVNDWVWTQHESTMVYGAYQVTQAKPFKADLWEADGYYRATFGHRMYLSNSWTTINSLGSLSGEGTAVAITVNDAHTFITLDKAGREVLNHNAKSYTPAD